MKLLTYIFVLSVFLLNSQTAPTIEWDKTIGGNIEDNFTKLKALNNGFIIGGYSRSNISGDKTEDTNGSWDFWVVKLDEAGNIEWQNTIGGASAEDSFTMSTTNDNGFIIGGISASSISGDKTEDSNNGDYWVLKLDNLGNIEWQNTIGGSNVDELNSVSQTSDGGYILGGSSNSPISFDKTEASHGMRDYWVVKLNSSGAIVWQNTIGGDNNDILRSIEETNDGGFILGGTSSSSISGDKSENSVGADYWVVKLNSSGNIVWQNTISGNLDDSLLVAIKTSDNGYILGGSSNSGIANDKTEETNGSLDFWVVKLDANGNIAWQNTIGGSGYDELGSIIETNDGSFVLGGLSNSNISGDKTENSKGAFDFWLIKINQTGDLTWQKTIGGNADDGLYSVDQTSDNGFILGGISNSNTSSDKTENSRGSFDYWVLKLTPESLSLNEYNLAEDNFIYPNPTKDKIYFKKKIKFEVVNQLGKRVHSGNNNEFDLNNLNSGVYFIRFSDNDGKTNITKKIIKN